MQRQKFRPYDWTLLQSISNKIIFAKNLIAKKEGFAALTVLNAIEFPYWMWAPPNEFITALKAKALAASGNTAKAYEDLILAFGEKPTTAKYKLIVHYGLMQNKDSTTIKSDIIAILRKDAAMASPFKLHNLKTSDSTSLKNFEGSTVLLTYWYPRCGPCRGEFPHLENVLKKVKQDVKYVSINIVAKEDEMVLPIMAANNYTFIPLTETKYRKLGNLDNKGAAPANFLIDKDGYLIFKDFMIGENNEADLALMISLLE